MFTTLRKTLHASLLLILVFAVQHSAHAAGLSGPAEPSQVTPSAAQPAPDPKPPQPVTPPPATPIPGGKTPPATDTEKLIYVKFVTTAGDIFVELNNEKAPISVKNFLSYVDKKAYDGTIFHRVIADFVIQGGGYKADLKEIKGEQPIKNEWQNGLKNLRGTIAMARDAEPDTATREFYFNTKDNAKLDTPRETTGKAGYAVFGKVVAGIAVVDKIRMGKTHDVSEEMKNVPDEPVTVTTITRLSPADAQRAIDAEPKSTPATPEPDPTKPPQKEVDKPRTNPPDKK